MNDFQKLIAEIFADDEFFNNTIKNLFIRGFDNADHVLPGASSCSALIKKQAKYVVNSGSTRYNGAKPFENATEALSETAGYLQDKIYSMLLASMMRGYLIGYDAKEWIGLSRVETAEKIVADEFQQACNDMCKVQSQEGDFIEVLSNKLSEILMSCAMATGYADTEGEEATTRVWDIWYHTLEAAGHGFHIYGYEAGTRLSTENEFYSIVGLDLSSTEN